MDDRPHSGAAPGDRHDDDDAAVRRYLHALPAAQPPAALGARVLRRHRLRRQRPMWLAAAALAMVALLLPLLLDRPPVIAPSVPSMAADDALLREIRALDRALQAAYQQPQPGPAVDTLWQARGAALARIDNPQASAPRPVRL